MTQIIWPKDSRPRRCNTESRPVHAGQFVAWYHKSSSADRSQLSPKSYIPIAKITT